MPFDVALLESYREPEFRIAKGAHENPEEGRCVLEWALAVGSFPHHAVTDAEDMPAGFSRAVCGYAQALNDTLPDDLRSRLLSPFVHRLAGSCRGPDLETECWRNIVREVYRRIVGEQYEPATVAYDVVNDIESSKHPQKWEIAVNILNEAISF